MPGRRYRLVPGPIFDVPMAGCIEDGNAGDLGICAGRLVIEGGFRLGLRDVVTSVVSGVPERSTD